jgi:predicted AAA+ superfamily ATPase
MGDVGLLGALSKMDIKSILQEDKIFTEFTGAFIENFVAQQLLSSDYKDQRELFYWTSDATAELDFIFQKGAEIRPLEVKSGENVKAKSLKVFYEKYDLFCYRTSPHNLEEQDWLKNVPLYAIKNIF